MRIADRAEDGLTCHAERAASSSEHQMERLLVFTATPGSEDAERLALLSVIGTRDFATSALV